MLDQVHLLADELQSFFQQEARRKLSRTKALEFCAKAYGFPTYNHVPKTIAVRVQDDHSGSLTLETVNGPATISEVPVNESSSFVERLLFRLKELSSVRGVHKIPVKLVGRPLCIVLVGGPSGAYGDYSLQFWESENGPVFYSHTELQSLIERDVLAFLSRGVLAAVDIFPDIKLINSLKVSSADLFASDSLSLSPRYYASLSMAKNSFEFI